MREHEKQLMTIIIIIFIIVGLVVAYIVVTTPLDTDNSQTQQIEIDESYVMAEGDFVCVDTFFQVMSDGGRTDSLWAHITVDGKKYVQEGDTYNYEWNRRIYLKFIIHYENNTISEPFVITIAVGYVYSFYVDDVLMTMYYKLRSG